MIVVQDRGMAEISQECQLLHQQREVWKIPVSGREIVRDVLK